MKFSLAFVSTLLATVVTDVASTPYGFDWRTADELILVRHDRMGDVRRHHSHRHGSDTNDDGDNDDRGNDRDTIIKRLDKDDRFSELVRYLQGSSNLRDDLDDQNAKVTLFAPTNEAIKRIERNFVRVFGKGPDDRDIEKILSYHIVREPISADKLRNGDLLRTSLKLQSLDNNEQRIHVASFRGDVYLNWYSRIEEKDVRASNGYIQVIDRVLLPPTNALELILTIPRWFSTFGSGLQLAKVSERVRDDKAITVFTPTNHAWLRLGFENVAYLFSDRGREDLEKILQYHVGQELYYSTDFASEEGKQIRLKTLYKDSELNIEVHQRNNRRDRDDRKRRDVRDDRDDPNRRDDNARQFVLFINDEAKVLSFDGVAENGVIHAIDEVLIPDDVRLPTERGGFEP